MALPLLALLSMGALGAGAWGRDLMAENRRAGFAEDMQGYQSQVDFSQPDAMHNYAKVLQQDPRMFTAGSNLLSSVAQREQQQRQYANTFNNLSANQQATLDQQQQRAQQQASAKLLADQQFSPTDMSSRQLNLDARYTKALQPYQEVQNVGGQILDIIERGGDNNLALGAAMTALVKLSDPSSIVSTAEKGDQIQAAAGGLYDQYNQVMKQAQDKGLTPQLKAKIAQLTTTIANANQESTLSALQNVAELAGGDGGLIPAINLPALANIERDTALLKNPYLESGKANPANDKSVATGKPAKVITANIGGAEVELFDTDPTAKTKSRGNRRSARR